MSLDDNPAGAAWKLELSSFLCVFNVCHLCSFLTLWWDFIWSIAIILKWKDLLKNPCCCRHKLVSSLCFVLLIFLSFIVLLWSSAWEQEPSSWLTLLAQIVLEKICWRSGSPQLTQKQSQQPEEWWRLIDVDGIGIDHVMIILISWLINLEYAKDDEGCEVETENLAAGGRSRQNLKSGSCSIKPNVRLLGGE